MKKKISKNQVVIATLAVLIAIAGYISYDKTGISLKPSSQQANADGESEDTVWDKMVWNDDTTEIVSNTESELNPGESVLTGNIINVTDYAAAMKINREQVRSANKEALMEIINNEQLSEEAKQDAVDQMVKLAEIAEMELNTEMLLEAKGFTNVVVSISDDSCDVVLDMGEISDAKRAQVEDIVKRKTGVTADKIVITPLNTSATE
ncbi:MAG: SpoIIIAH-like family protein [Agathobacter sp.]|nr:SpoIIIAH-like family protein [Agathobacter sp.]